MSKILVVGNSSLAKYLVPALKGDEVVTMGRKHCDIYGDLDESISIPAGTDIVIHTAGLFESKTDAQIMQTAKTNSIGTLKVCIAGSTAGVKHIVLISSIYALLDSISPYYGIYSISKRHSEELAEYYCKLRGVQLTILRPSQIYDAQGLFRKSQPFLYWIADCAEHNQEIKIFGNNDALKNFIHIEDLVEIIVRTIREKVVGTYSCTYSENVKITEIANAAIKAFNSSSKVVFLREKADISDNAFDGSSELYQKIGFQPQIDINIGMRKLSEYRKSSK
jgi:nucleoside-diphosphate-sugar epimerase